MIAAVFCFSCMDTILGLLGHRHDPWFLAWGRSCVQVGLLLVLSPLLGWRKVLVTRRPGVQLARGAVLVMTSVCLIYALRSMPLTQAYAIGFSAPMIAALLAAALLDEWPDRKQWLLIVAGFIGVMVALRPDAPDAGWTLLLPLGFAFANGSFHVLTRIASASDPAYSQLFFAALFATLLLSLGLPWTWTSLATTEWMLLGVAGVFGTLAHFLLVNAFTRAPTAVVSPMVYFQVVWAAIVSFIVLGAVPSGSTIAGAAIVAAAGIGLIRHTVAR